MPIFGSDSNAGAQSGNIMKAPDISYRFSEGTLYPPLGTFDYLSYNVTGAGNYLNRICFHPYPVAYDTFVDEMCVAINTAEAGKSVRFGLWATNPDNGKPMGEPIYDSGVVGLDTTGIKSVSINETLPAGKYWSGVISNATSAKAWGVTKRMHTVLGIPNTTSVSTTINGYGYKTGTMGTWASGGSLEVFVVGGTAFTQESSSSQGNWVVLLSQGIAS